MSSGKWYFEVTAGDANAGIIGVTPATFSTGGSIVDPFAIGYGYITSGNKRILNVDTAYGATYTTNDVIGVAFDGDAGTLTFYKNGTSQGQATSGITVPVIPACYGGSGTLNNVFTLNAGQRPFAYTPPTGFKALNTQNLPDATIKKGNQFFDVSLFTGTGSAQTITNSGAMQPDLVWIKSRGEVASHRLVDSVRGVDKVVYSNLTNAEATEDGVVDSFNSNGFTGGGANAVTSGYAGVAWQWKESASAGFDIVTYTGTGANRTVAHSLGVAPKMMIVKSRNTAGTYWCVYHESLGPTKYIYLNTTSAAGTFSAFWNDTAPTSSVFTVGTQADTNGSGYTQVAYLFSEVAGFSKFGSYVGNGSADGPFVFTGFRPRFILIKSSTSVQDWKIIDTARNTYNSSNSLLGANISGAEDTNAAYNFDILSNGFKPRNTFGYANTSGATYIYAAFAENPFKNSLAR
jgi:hypothetical protein